MSDILVHRDNRFGIIVTGGYSSEEFCLGSVCLTQTLWFRWVKCWFHLPQLKHGGQDWPDWLDQGFPVPPGTEHPPNHVDARANDQNVCKGVFCSIALASRRPRCSTTTAWSRGKGRHPVFDALSVENCGWTACPLGEWTVRLNNTRTVVSKLLDWMFGIIPGSWKPCPSW
jgi:hypothetical protein